MEDKQANRTKQNKNRLNYKQGLQLDCASEELAQRPVDIYAETFKDP